MNNNKLYRDVTCSAPSRIELVEPAPRQKKQSRSGRIGCLWVPDIPLSALLRTEPELCGTPVAIVQSEGPRAQVLACSPEASRTGIVPGMTATGAQSLLSNLIVRPLSGAKVRSAQAALLDVARSFSPKVALEPGGEICMDLSGLECLFSSEQKLGSALLTRSQKVGLEARVGIAASKLCALLAARTTRGLRVVPAGQEREFLAPLPINLLKASAELHASLRRFGIERLGELAELPSEGLGLRLGAAGLRLWRLARGEYHHPLVPSPTSRRMLEEIECEYPIDQMEPLLFAMQGVFERLSKRLQTMGLKARKLFLSLDLDPKGADERALYLASPSLEVSTWLRVAQLSLEKQPPRATVTIVRAEAEETAIKHSQLDLFVRRATADFSISRLDDTVARLAALSGKERVGSPRPVDSYRTGEFAMAPFAPRPESDKAMQSCDTRNNMPLRAVRPAEQVRVQLDHTRPVRAFKVDGSRARCFA